MRDFNDTQWEKSAKLPVIIRSPTVQELNHSHFGLLALSQKMLHSHGLDAELPSDEVVADLSATLDKAKTIESLALKLQRLSDDLKIGYCPDLERERLPIIADMGGQHFVLVTHVTSQEVALVESQGSLRAYKVPTDQFFAYFSGKVIRLKDADPELEVQNTLWSEDSHWFWSSLKNRSGVWAQLAVAATASNFLALATVVFSLQVYDRVIPNSSLPTLWIFTIAVLGALVFDFLLRSVRSFLMDNVCQQIEIELHDTLLRRVFNTPIDQRPLGTAGLAFSVREFRTVRDFFTAASIGALIDIPFTLLFLGVVWLIAGQISLVLLAAGLLICAPALIFGRQLTRLAKSSMSSASGFSQLVQQAVFNQHTIQEDNAQGAYLARFNDELIRLSRASGDQRGLTTKLGQWSASVQQIAFVAVIFFGAIMVINEELSIGALVATSLMTSRCLAPLTQLSSILSRWTQVRSALGLLDKLFDAPKIKLAKKQYFPNPKFDQDLKLKNIRYCFGEGPPVLDIDLFHVKAGQKVALLGRNGSGKSTLLKVLARLYTKHTASYDLGPLDINQIDPEHFHQNIGMLSDIGTPLSGTLRYNLNLGSRSFDDDTLLAALDFAGLGEFVRQHCYGLELEIDDDGDGLSLGQKQAFRWAKLYLKDPQIVLLDEPTAQLDQGNEVALVNRLESWFRDRTVVLATHRTPILQLVDRVMVLDCGKIAVDGPKKDVLQYIADKTKEAQK